MHQCTFKMHAYVCFRICVFRHVWYYLQLGNKSLESNSFSKSDANNCEYKIPNVFFFFLIWAYVEFSVLDASATRESVFLLELRMDFKMSRQTAVRLHEQCSLIHNEGSRRALWKPELFVPRYCVSSWPASFSGTSVFWQHLANLIDDVIAGSSTKETIKAQWFFCLVGAGRRSVDAVRWGNRGRADRWLRGASPFSIRFATVPQRKATREISFP